MGDVRERPPRARCILVDDGGFDSLEDGAHFAARRLHKYADCIATESPTERAEMKPIRKFLDDTRGAVLVEYSVVVGTVAIVSMLAFVALGIALAHDFRFLRSNLFMPYP